MAVITVLENGFVDIPVNYFVNGSSTGVWNIASTITHDNNLGSYASKSLPSLVVGNTYKVTYMVNSYTSCGVQCYLGDTAGTLNSSAGTFVDTFVFSGTNKKIRFYATGTVSINHYKIEELVTTINDTIIDYTQLVNNSWTLSFSPLINQWLSFHSYLPNNYLIHPTNFLAKRNDTDIKLSNSGNYGVFFDEDIKPFIIESIFNEAKINTKVFDSISVIMDTYDENGVPTNTFFDQGIIYTENQCSGTITFNIGSNVTRKEKNWNFNKFQDITNNLTENIFISDWDNIKTSYPIDKIVNIDKIDTSKPWYERGRMRDKYLAVRFIDLNLDNTKFICKFVINSFRASTR